MVYAPYVPPGELQYTSILQASGAQVFYATTDNDPPKELDRGVKLLHQPVVSQKILSSGFSGRFKSFRERKRIFRTQIKTLNTFLQQVKPDYVIANDLELGMPVLAKTAYTCKKLARALGSDIYVVAQRGGKHAKKIRDSIRAAQGLIAQTATQKQALQTFMANAALTCPIQVVRAWLDTELFKPQIQISLKKEQKKAYDFLVLCLRGSKPIYRPRVVIEAAALAYKALRARGKSLKLRMLASPEDASGLREFAANLGLEEAAFETVQKRIPFKHMPQEYAQADIVLQALLNEGMGYTALEAMACERIVIQPRTPLAEELFPPGQLRFLSKPAGDAASLGKALEQALEDQSTLEKQEKANRQFILENLERKKVLAKEGQALKYWLESLGS